jgi:replicative DNA helicase
LHGAGHPVDPLTVYDELQRCDHLEELQRGDHGPEDYLRVLFEGCPTAAKRRLR